MKLKMLSVVTFLMQATLNFAQPWYLSYAPHGRDVSASAMVNPSQIVLGSGFEIADQFEEFFRSNDYGLGWNVTSTNVNTSQVMSIAFHDSMTAYGVCRHGKIVSTVDGGNSWANRDTFKQRDFFKLIFADAQTLFAVGGSRTDDSATIVKSSNGGLNWNVVYNQPGNKLRSVYFFDPQTGIAVGDQAQILTTTNGGTNWSVVASPVLGRHFYDIEFVDANVGFIVGGLADSLQTVLKTTNGGVNWAVVYDGVGGFLRDIEFVNSAIGYIAGDSATVRKTTDGGQSWVTELLPNTNPDQHINTISFYNNNYGLVAGNGGYICIYANTTPPEAITLSSMPIDTTNVTLIGSVNTKGIPGQCDFIVSTDSMLSFAQSQYVHNGMGSLVTDSATLFSVNVNNLSPDTTYFFCCRTTTLAGVSYGDTLSFRPQLPGYTFQTYNPTVVNDTTATFAGGVNKLTGSVNISFDYGTSPAMSSSVVGNPAIVSDSLNHNITATVYGLQPHVLYYCRMRGTDGIKTYVGAPFTFFTGNPYSSLQTLAATNVTNTSAVLNGFIEGATVNMNLYFNYGPNPNMNLNAQAVPSSVSDTLYHAVSLPLQNLLPNTMYYFQIKGTVNNAAFTGSTVSFFTGNPNFALNTLQATSVTGNTAVLQGEINKQPGVTNLWFEYGPTNSLGLIAQATPSVVSDTLYHAVSSVISGLSPFSNYYYRLVGQLGGTLLYGSVNSFQTISPTSNFQSTGATDVNTNSATLNGRVHYLTSSYSMSFDYGTDTTAYTNIAATPATVSDTGLYNLIANVTGLQTNTVYYCRLKGESGGTTRYGDWVSFFTGNEIPNWDFQFWTHDTVMIPFDWGFVSDGFSRVPGHTGNYGLHISGSNFGLKGMVGDGLFGGQVFNARPDSFSVYLQHNIVPGDTAALALFMSNSNGIVAQNFFMITGNTSGGYQHYTFPITYENGQMPDSLAIAMVPSIRLFAGLPIINPNSLTVDDMSFIPNNATIVNGDFENWFSFEYDNPESWYFPKFLQIQPTDTCHPSFQKKFYNAPDDYALQLTTVTRNNYKLAFGIATDPSIFKTTYSGFPVSTRYQTFNGEYQFMPDNNDTLNIDVSFFKQQQYVGYASFQATSATSGFTPFSSVIYYVNNLTPDTATLSINFNHKTLIGNPTALVDKLSLRGYLALNLPTLTAEDLKVYPNPTPDWLTVEFPGVLGDEGTIQLYSLNGQLQSELPVSLGDTKTQFSLESLPAGVYLLRFTSGVTTLNKKIVVIK